MAATTFLASLALVSSASAAQRIAWVSDRDGNPEIYAAERDGSALSRLTTFAGEDIDPAYSPDQKRIAFAREVAPKNYEIFVMNADGSGVVQLTATPRSDRYPVWSPDGSAIAFRSNRAADRRNDDGFDIWVMAADGSSPTRLTASDGLDSEPAWSSRNVIAFSSERDGNSEIYAMAADGGGQRRLTTNPGIDRHPWFTPDGASLVFSSRRDGARAALWTMGADGGAASLLVAGSGQESHPAFSPDGTEMIFDRATGGNHSLWIRSADGSVTPFADGAANDWNATWATFGGPAATGAGAVSAETPSGATPASLRASAADPLRVTLGGHRRQRVRQRRGIRVATRCNHACNVRFTATFRFGAKRASSKARRRLAMGIRAFTRKLPSSVVRRYKVAFRKSALTRVLANVAKGRRVELRLKVVARDASGGVAAARRTYLLRR